MSKKCREVTNTEGIDQPQMSNVEYIELKVNPSIKQIKFSPKEIEVPQTDKLIYLRETIAKVVD